MMPRLALALALVGASGLFIATACDDPNSGYYWWDSTNDVWCYTYANGDTECDTPNGHSHGPNDCPGGAACDGDNDNGGDTSAGDSDNGGDGSVGGDIDGGDNGGDSDGGGDGGTGTPTPASCTDNADGTRSCIVTDGDRICEFTYNSDGVITGGYCAETDGCTPQSNGGLICEFETTSGDQCIVVFDSAGAIEFDPCHYFQAPPSG
jgi:hypothetical protein